MSSNTFSPESSFGKMWPDFDLPTMDGILRESYEAWPMLVISEPHGVWTPNSGVSLSAGKDTSVCSLETILETNGTVPAKYWLSKKACVGILRRAAKRGKELPEDLRHALEQVASGPSESETQEGKIQ